jgi:DNA-directed RNA polymerase specialized sigma24 family protein
MDECKGIVYKAEIDAGSHSYRLEVRRARNGSRYLKITDHRLKDDGESPCKGLIVFEDHAPEFLWELTKALAYLNAEGYRDEKSADGSDATERLAEIRLRYPRAYEPWTPAEESRLRLAYNQGESAQQVATMLGRQPSAVQSRLQRLGLCR